MDYDRNGRRYGLKPESYQVLVDHIEATLPLKFPSTPAILPVRRDDSIRQQSAPFTFSSTVAQSISRDLQNLRLPIAAHSSPRRSTGPIRAQSALVFPGSNRPTPVLFHVPQYTTYQPRPVPVVGESYQGRRIYDERALNERTPLLPHAHTRTRRRVFTPYSGYSALLFILVFFAFMAYAAYRWSLRGSRF